MPEKQTSEERALAVVDQSLDAYKPEFARLLGESVDPDVFMSVAYEAFRTNRDLLEIALTAPDSLMKALHDAAALKLVPNGVLGSAYIVPRKNKNTQRKEAHFQVGYRGLVELIMRSGHVSNVQSRVVYANEPFRIVYGTTPRIEHEPILDGAERGKVRGFYAVARMRDGSHVMDYMTVDQVNVIRDRSPSKSGPWSTDYEEMGRKTVIRRLAKALPMSVEVQRAVELDDAAEGTTEVISATVEQPAGSLAGRVRQLTGTAAPKDVTPEQVREGITDQQAAFVEGKTDDPGEPPQGQVVEGAATVQRVASEEAPAQATVEEAAAVKPKTRKAAAKAAEPESAPETAPDASIEQASDDVPDDDAPAPTETPKQHTFTSDQKPPRELQAIDGVIEPQPSGGVKLITEQWKGKLVSPHDADDKPIADDQVEHFLTSLSDTSYEARIHGIIEYVPWERDGKAMPPYRKIVAYLIEPGAAVA